MENLKNLLLTPPLLGETIVAIDPGFSNGCKVGVSAPNGDVIDTHVIYPHSTSTRFIMEAKDYLIEIILKFR